MVKNMENKEDRNMVGTAERSAAMLTQETFMKKELFWGAYEADEFVCGYTVSDSQAVAVSMPRKVYGYHFAPTKDATSLIEQIREFIPNDKDVVIFQFYIPDGEMENIFAAITGHSEEGSYTVNAIEWFHLSGYRFSEQDRQHA